MAVHTFWNTLNACNYRYTCDCKADRSQRRVGCNWNNYQALHSIYLAQRDKQTNKQTNKQTQIMFCYCKPSWYRQTRCDKFWERLSTSCKSHTSYNQHHEAVLFQILRIVQMEREPLPIMEPKGSKHPSTSSSHKPHNSNPKDQMSSKYPAFKPVTKCNLQKVMTNCPSPYHKGIHG